MSVIVSMPLFGNPGHEMEEGAFARGNDLRKLADTLAERLKGAADVLDRLIASGWRARVAQFDLILEHSRVADREQAEALLRAAEVDPGLMMILEEIEDEDVLD